MKTNQPLTVTIEIHDRNGKKIGEKEVASYAGLLAKAHDEGLRSIATEIIQTPTATNGEVAIVRAIVETQKGRFTGIGDANPSNVNRRVTAHLIRMAETRAKARALRDAVNIGVVALDELGELIEEDVASSVPMAAPSTTTTPQPALPRTVPTRGDFQPMTDPQRRMLFRLAAQHGATPDESQRWLEQYLKVPALKEVSRAEASRAIDALQPKPNGNGNGADHGVRA